MPKEIYVELPELSIRQSQNENSLADEFIKFRVPVNQSGLPSHLSYCTTTNLNSQYDALKGSRSGDIATLEVYKKGEELMRWQPNTQDPTKGKYVSEKVPAGGRIVFVNIKASKAGQQDWFTAVYGDISKQSIFGGMPTDGRLAVATEATPDPVAEAVEETAE